jgi:hypothetical protein
MKLGHFREGVELSDRKIGKERRLAEECNATLVQIVYQAAMT